MAFLTCSTISFQSLSIGSLLNSASMTLAWLHWSSSCMKFGFFCSDICLSLSASLSALAAGSLPCSLHRTSGAWSVLARISEITFESVRQRQACQRQDKTPAIDLALPRSSDSCTSRHRSEEHTSELQSLRH